MTAAYFVKDDNRRQPQQEHKREEKHFDSLLADAIDRRRAEDISVKTNGYTRNAMPMMYFVNMREYTYQGQ